VLGSQAEAVPAIAGLDHLVASPAQQAGHSAQRSRIVVRDKYAGALDTFFHAQAASEE
jgi:hypothetical protein